MPPAIPPVTPSVSSADVAKVNQANLAACAKAEGLLVKARTHATLFTPEEIDEPFLSALETACARFRFLTTQGQLSTGDKVDATKAEEAAHLNLVIAAQAVQSCARQKYHTDQPGRLSAYHINHRLSGVKYNILIQFTQDMINLLTGDTENPADTLPGLTPVRLTTLVDARKAYIDAHAAQDDEQKGASQARLDGNALIHQITAERLKIQFAADRIWPWQLATSTVSRREFLLTENRPFIG